MGKVKLLVTQVLRVERTIEVEVEAGSTLEATIRFGDGEIDLPTEGWTVTHSDLMHEEADPA